MENFDLHSYISFDDLTLEIAMQRVNINPDPTNIKEIERHCQYLMDAAMLQNGVNQKKADELWDMFDKQKDLIDQYYGPSTVTFKDGVKISIYAHKDKQEIK